jgi:hypothetical protein
MRQEVFLREIARRFLERPLVFGKRKHESLVR